MGKGELDNPTVCFPCFRSKRVFRLRFRKHRQSYFSCHETKGLSSSLCVSHVPVEYNLLV